ncbi:ATP-dependent RNA helicase mtr4, partial [Coemansia sp. Cherry 401B]
SKTNKGKQTSSTSDIYKIVCMTMVCNYHPVIVFCFCKHKCEAAKAIGNVGFENKFANSIAKIKRDAIFAASLYL